MITADAKHHVYYRLSDSSWEIYDLEHDPDEKHNTASAAGASRSSRPSAHGSKARSRCRRRQVADGDGVSFVSFPDSRTS